jgi:SNF2 family DNA or RNA helicase
MDLYGQLRAAGRLNGISPFVWRNRFCEMGGFQNKQIVGMRDPKGLAEFVSDSIFYATKEEWLDTLPEKTFSQIRVDMTDAQQEMYDQIRLDFLTSINGRVVTAPMVLTVMTKLSQISMGFLIDESQEVHFIEKGVENPKLAALLEVLNSLGPKQKVVVFGVNRATLTLVRDVLDQRKIKSVTIVGGADADASKWRFNQEDDVRVCLATQSSGGMGLTLLGTPNVPCSTIIFLQNMWGLQYRQQACDRIHRIGQNYPCLYIDITASRIDERVLDALQWKTDMQKSVLEALK